MPEKNEARRVRRQFRELLPLAFLAKPLRCFCVNCGKHVPSDWLWQCGHCEHDHESVRTYSFLNRCEVCKKAPKSFVCPYCEQHNFFDNDRIAANPARAVGPKCKSPTAEELRAQKIAANAFERDELQHDVEVARLRAEIQKHSGRSPAERILKDIAERGEIFMAREESYRSLSELFEKKYQNDRERLRKGREFIERLRDEESLE